MVILLYYTIDNLGTASPVLATDRPARDAGLGIQVFIAENMDLLVAQATDLHVVSGTVLRLDPDSIAIALKALEAGAAFALVLVKILLGVDEVTIPALAVPEEDATLLRSAPAHASTLLRDHPTTESPLDVLLRGILATLEHDWTLDAIGVDQLLEPCILLGTRLHP